ncbi:hypothetical protein BpHYR1_032817 [Brachionus plicatilis]|uniref:Uncharacterized protein n=1 Tax=Brachionus plicatilis TaxID=10195 RepID=A0A3M7SHE0_BRAPC|nr:hypothetical protein BpHYR1_032817 [Brachionus plicatilis]
MEIKTGYIKIIVEYHINDFWVGLPLFLFCPIGPDLLIEQKYSLRKLRQMDRDQTSIHIQYQLLTVGTGLRYLLLRVSSPIRLDQVFQRLNIKLVEIALFQCYSNIGYILFVKKK